jgi:hypothetical protein
MALGCTQRVHQVFLRIKAVQLRPFRWIEGFLVFNGYGSRLAIPL